MIGTLLRKELTDHLQSFRFFITMLLCLVLIPLGIFVGAREYKNVLSDYRQSMALYQESMQGSKNPHQVEAKGMRPPSPFSIFAAGLDRFLPDEILATEKGGLMLGSNRSMDSPHSILFGKIDFLFIVGVVMSLLAVLFTFDAVTREKELGTLRLMLSNGFPRHHILIGKFIGNFLTFLIPFTLSLLLGILILSLTGVFPLFQPGILLRLALMVLASLLFLSAFFNLGLLATALSQRSLTSQIVLLFLWIVLIFAVPRAGGMLSEIILPVKTHQTVQLEKALVRKNSEDEKAAALKQLFLDAQENKTADTYDREREPIVRRLAEKEKNGLDAIDREYENRKARQTQIAAICSRLSPFASFAYFLTELSDTGILQMNHFYQTAGSFYDQMERDVYSMGYYDEIPGYGMRMSFGGWVSWDNIPKFQLQPIPFSLTFRAVWVDLLLLALFNLVFFIGAYVAFLRYDVR